MPRPSIGVVIATPGRASIFRTLQSILYQGLEPGDEILVVGDGHHDAIANLVAALGKPFSYVATEVTRTWGHDQLNYGVARVGGDVIIYQDDDDIFAPRAFDEIRRLATRFPNAPFLGRIKTPYNRLLWDVASPNATLDGHCLVVPNVKDKLGYFTREYAGDQAWIKTCLEPYEDLYWADRVWSLTRPTWMMYPHRATVELIYKVSDMGLDNLTSRGHDCVPQTTGRLYNGPNDWAWYFYRPTMPGESPRPVAFVRMYQDGERMMAGVSYTDEIGNGYTELAEFIAWAAQGLDVWVHVHETESDMIEGLTDVGYEAHGTVNGISEYIHSWPPKWFVSKENKPLIVRPNE